MSYELSKRARTINKIFKNRKLKNCLALILMSLCMSLFALLIGIRKFITPQILEQAVLYGFLTDAQVNDINNASHNVKHLIKMILSTPRFTYYYIVMFIYALILVYAVHKLYIFIFTIMGKRRV